MTREKIKEKIVGIIEDLGVGVEVTEESSLANDLGFDSLDVVELLMSIEDEFEVEIPDEEIENIKTIGDLTDYIQNNM